MSIITTTRTFQRGDQFTFTVAAKNGYGINCADIPSMSEYLVEDSEVISPIGSSFPGHHNYGLYPGVSVSGVLEDTSVNYSLLLGNNGCVQQLSYTIKFNGGENPISGNGVSISIDGVPSTNIIDPYMWSAEPLILPTPQIIWTEPESDEIYFTVWHCVNDNNDYAPGSRIYVSDDMSFDARWAAIPVNVSVESNTESSTIPEFENE